MHNRLAIFAYCNQEDKSFIGRHHIVAIYFLFMRILFIHPALMDRSVLRFIQCLAVSPLILFSFSILSLFISSDYLSPADQRVYSLLITFTLDIGGVLVFLAFYNILSVYQDFEIIGKALNKIAILKILLSIYDQIFPSTDLVGILGILLYGVISAFYFNKVRKAIIVQAFDFFKLKRKFLVTLRLHTIFGFSIVLGGFFFIFESIEYMFIAVFIQRYLASLKRRPNESSNTTGYLENNQQ